MAAPRYREVKAAVLLTLELSIVVRARLHGLR
jgi:hypothetical protein